MSFKPGDVVVCIGDYPSIVDTGIDRYFWDIRLGGLYTVEEQVRGKIHHGLTFIKLIGKKWVYTSARFRLASEREINV